MITPLPDGRLAALKALDTCSIAKAICTYGVRMDNEGFANAEIVCRFPAAAPMVGYAVTATVSCSAPAMPGQPQESLDRFCDCILEVPAPRVLVIQDVDPAGPGAGALIGEINAHIFKALGCEGIITDGAVRELNRIHHIAHQRGGFQVFSRSLSPAQSFAHLVTMGGEVEIGGLAIAPGTLLHGDEHGFVVIPQAIASSIPLAAERVHDRERRIIAACHAPQFSLAQLRASLGGGSTAIPAQNRHAP